MAYDYTDDQAFGVAEIAEYGRQVVIQRYSDQPTDSNAPWDGKGPANQPDQAIPTMMVFVPPSSATALGLRGVDEALLKRFEQIAICPHPPGSTDDLREFDMILDGGQLWRIIWSETLRPGSVNVLYFFGVMR